MRTQDGTIVEVFEWVSQEAIVGAHTNPGSSICGGVSRRCVNTRRHPTCRNFRRCSLTSSQFRFRRKPGPGRSEHLLLTAALGKRPTIPRPLQWYSISGHDYMSRWICKRYGADWLRRENRTPADRPRLVPTRGRGRILSPPSSATLFRSRTKSQNQCLRHHMHTFTSFDGTRIAYHDEGDGPAVILLHGFGVDALGQFREFERILPGLEKRQAMFRQAFGGAPPLPDPPPEGRPGTCAPRRRCPHHPAGHARLRSLRQAARKRAYEDSALSRDIVALIDHLHLGAVDVIGS
jgi:hypothetical protein